MKLIIYFLKVSAGLISFILFILLIPGCSSTKELTSDWNKSKVKIDGNPTEWSDELRYLKDDNIAVGFLNDDKDLYLCLTTADISKVMQMFRGGLTIMIEPENGGKVFGIKFPFMDFAGMRNNFKRSEGDGDNPGLDGGYRGAFIKKVIVNQRQIQIVNEDQKVINVLPVVNKNGIKAALGYYNDQFVYELEVPLRSGSNFPFLIDAVTGEKINLKIETGEIKRPNLKRQEGEGNGTFGGEGRDEMGGRRGGGRRSGGIQRGEYQYKPIDVSIELTLAETY